MSSCKKTTPTRRSNLIEIFIRYLWQINSSISNLDEIEAKLHCLNIDIPKIQESISSQGSRGALKAVHLFFIKILFEKGVQVSNIQGIINTLSKIPFCNNLYRNSISQLQERNLIQDSNQREKVCANISGDLILLTNSKTGEILDNISIHNASTNAKKSFNIMLTEQSARAKQGTMAIGLTILTKLSLRQIGELTKLRIRLIKAILLYSVFKGDQIKFKNRFRKIVDQTVINQIITLTKFTDYTIQEIAKRSKCGSNTVRRYSLKYVFFDNEGLFKIRFNPDIPGID